MKSTIALSAVLSLLGTVQANTPVPNSVVNGSGGIYQLVKGSRPMWHFGQAMNQKPCYPEAALQASGAKIPSTDPKAWPVANGGSCADPGDRVGVNTKGNSFPT